MQHDPSTDKWHLVKRNNIHIAFDQHLFQTLRYSRLLRVDVVGLRYPLHPSYTNEHNWGFLIRLDYGSSLDIQCVPEDGRIAVEITLREYEVADETLGYTIDHLPNISLDNIIDSLIQVQGRIADSTCPPIERDNIWWCLRVLSCWEEKRYVPLWTDTYCYNAICKLMEHTWGPI